MLPHTRRSLAQRRLSTSMHPLHTLQDQSANSCTAVQAICGTDRYSLRNLWDRYGFTMQNQLHRFSIALTELRGRGRECGQSWFKAMRPLKMLKDMVDGTAHHYCKPWVSKTKECWGWECHRSKIFKTGLSNRNLPKITRNWRLKRLRQHRSGYPREE